MKKKLVNIGGNSKGIILPSEIISELEEVEMDLDTLNRKIIISY